MYSVGGRVVSPKVRSVHPLPSQPCSSAFLPLRTLLSTLPTPQPLLLHTLLKASSQYKTLSCPRSRKRLSALLSNFHIHHHELNSG